MKSGKRSPRSKNEDETPPQAQAGAIPQPPGFPVVNDQMHHNHIQGATEDVGSVGVGLCKSQSATIGARMILRVPYITPFMRALFNGTTEALEIQIDRSAPDEYWVCVGVDKNKLPWLKEQE